VNSAIYSQSGGSVGIGFAVPSNIARKTAEDLVNNNGKIVRAGIGAVVQSLSPAMAKSFGLSSNQGAPLSDINPGGAAEKAGLKPGDLVLAINGSTITDSGDLVSRLYTFHPADVITLTILRNGVQSDVPVTLQQLDEAALEKKAGDQGQDSNGLSGQGQNDDLGLVYQDQTPDIRSQLPQGAPRGPVITEVAQQSPAAVSGLQQGDIILKLGNSPIVSANQLTVLLKKSDLKNGVRLFVWRDGETLYTILQSGDE
jgi:serine protease Do